MILTIPSLSGLHVFYGDANQALARVYVRLAGIAAGAEYRLSGTVIGPVCVRSQTLSASIPLVDCGPGSALLAEAVIPDPCFWSDELPFLYRVEVELRRGATIVAKATRWLGVKLLGTVGRRLMRDRRTWVVRGVRQTASGRTPLSAWNEAVSAMIVDDPDEGLLKEASKSGVWIVARVSRPSLDIADAVERLSRWPAVCLAVLPSGMGLDPATRLAAKNLLLGEEFGPSQAIAPASWANVVVCRSERADDLAERSAGGLLPVIARRDVDPASTLDEARAACDRLQRDLAGRGDFAGYFV